MMTIPGVTKKCINRSCGLSYEINNDIYRCSCGSLLDINTAKRNPELLSTCFLKGETMEGTYIMRVEFGVSVI